MCYLLETFYGLETFLSNVIEAVLTGGNDVNFRGTHIPSGWSPGRLLLTLAPDIVSTLMAVFFRTYQNVYHFKCTELKASDNNEVLMSFPNCKSSVQNFLHIALGRLDFAGCS